MPNLPSTGERLLTSWHNKNMVEHLHRYSFAERYTNGKTVLDIASGEGYGSNLLSKTAKFVYGVDISHEAVAHAAGKYIGNNIKFFQGSAAEIPLPDKSVDVVVSFETIEHHDKHDEMMQECKRVLTDGGVLVISSPDKKYYTDIPNYKNPYHVKELYKHEFEGLLKKYFSHVHLFKQGITHGSIIYGENEHKQDGVELRGGTYEKLEKLSDIQSPDYVIAVAANVEVETHADSFFESDYVNQALHNELKKYKQGYEKVTASTAYRIGLSISRPFVFLSKAKGGAKNNKKG